MSKLSELTPGEKVQAKKSVRDLIWKLRNRFFIEAGAKPVVKHRSKKEEAEFLPRYVYWLEENFIVQDVIIKMSGMDTKRIEEMIKKAGLHHAKPGE